MAGEHKTRDQDGTIHLKINYHANVEIFICHDMLLPQVLPCTVRACTVKHGIFNNQKIKGHLDPEAKWLLTTSICSRGKYIFQRD